VLCNGFRRWLGLNVAARLALAVILVAAIGFGPSLVQAKEPIFGGPAGTVTVSQLPPQGRDMLTLIYQGGPFRYDKDGTVFGNRERALPARNRGYYREYTVRTPKERTRGARRIICGGLKPAAPDTCYYTDDHYASFRKITQ
jgi:ribonuclease T1